MKNIKAITFITLFFLLRIYQLLGKNNENQSVTFNTNQQQIHKFCGRCKERLTAKPVYIERGKSAKYL